MEATTILRTSAKTALKAALPASTYKTLRRMAYSRDFSAIAAFLGQNSEISIRTKLRLLKRIFRISREVTSPHTHREILEFMTAILSLTPLNKGVIVEAGCYKGSSTAKFSLAAHLADRELFVFDSFQGMPEYAADEKEQITIFGTAASFRKGDYCGRLDEVKANVAWYGKIEVCRFVPGWFEDTMPHFRHTISAAYLDVDLASSTRTCLRYLYPLLEPGGAVYSQDAHLPLVIDTLSDEKFWNYEVRCEKPEIFGLGEKKLVKMVKPSSLVS